MNNTKKKFQITVTIILLVIVSAISVTLAEINHNSEPFYKLPPNIQREFRQEWVWNDDLQEYETLQGLIRDKSTGLFPEPKDAPAGLAGYATWDPYLGLYIANSIKIDYSNDTISEVQPSMDDSNRIHWPDYDIEEQNTFNAGYLKYQKFILDKYFDGKSFYSTAVQDLMIFYDEQLTPDFFGLDVDDLPMIVTKLEEGAPPAYTMSLITFLLHADFGIYPSTGDSYHLDDWVLAFNTMKAEVKSRIASNDSECLGYLVLPELYQEMKSGKTINLNTLTEIATGLPGIDQAVASCWGQEQWLTWFDDHADIISDLQWVIDHEIVMPWLK